jgi:hypothetical protein
METQDRELGFAGRGRFHQHNRQSRTEFKNLLVETTLSLKLSVESENESRGCFLLNFTKYHTEDGQSFPCITGLKNSLGLSWRMPAVDAPEGFALEAAIWRGGPPSLGYFAFEKPRPQTSRSLHPVYSIANGYVWIDDDGPEEYSAQALAEELIAWYLDNGLRD